MKDGVEMAESKIPKYSIGLEKEAHLTDYINVVLRRWKIVLIIFLTVFLGVVVYTFVKQPVYEAFATLEVRKAQKNGMLQELGVAEESSLSTEIEVLQSRSLAEQVAKRLNLDWQIASLSEGLDIGVDQYVVTTPLPGVAIVLKQDGAYQVNDLSGRKLGDGRSGEPFDVDGLRMLLTIRKGHPGQTMVIERQPLEPMVESIMNSLRISEMGKGSNILRVSSQSTDPARARDVVNILTEVYREMNVAAKTREAGKTVEFIGSQLEGLKGVLDRSEQDLQEYKVQTGLMSLGPEGNSLVQKLVEIEAQKAELGMKRQRVEFAIRSLGEAISNESYFNPPAIEGIPQVADAATRLAALEAEKKALLNEFTPAHPQVVNIQSDIKRVQETLLGTYQSVHQELVMQERDLASTIADYEKQLEDVPEAELELAKRTRVHKVNAELYTFLLQKQQEARIAQASTLSSVEIIDPALTPKVPIKPNKKKNLALGLILGMMLGVGMAFLLDYMDQTIKTSEEVQEKLGLNVFGIIPRIPFADEDAQLPRKRLVTTLAPKEPVVEAFRSLRTNLNYLTGKQNHKIIMVTSSLPNEGKSTVSGNLAVVLAQTGAKVLLIGCDLRRPSLYDMFGLKNEPGLTNLMIDEDKNALRHIANPRLDFLSAGTLPPNPAEILESERMRKLLTTVRERYDYVVLDAPPVLPVTDAQILGPLADINLVVIEPCRVPEKAAMQMVETLQSVDAKIAGVVMNDKSGRGFKYYGNYSYYGNKYYRGYYGESEEDLKQGPIVGAMKKVWEKLNS